jgi:SAM-dependent methyltransferase
MTISLLTSVIFSPSVHTPKKLLGEIIRHINPKDFDIVYDLGSGDGRILIAIKKFAKIKGYGYDISPIIVLISKISRFLNLRFDHNLEFDVSNIFSLKLKDPDIIYVFQPEKILNILETKFKRELKNVKVFTYKYKLGNTKEKKKYKLEDGTYLFEYRY